LLEDLNQAAVAAEGDWSMRAAQLQYEMMLPAQAGPNQFTGEGVAPGFMDSLPVFAAGDLTEREFSTSEQMLLVAYRMPLTGLFDLTVPMYPDQPVVGYAPESRRATIDQLLEEIAPSIPSYIRLVWTRQPVEMGWENGNTAFALIALQVPEAPPLSSDFFEELQIPTRTCCSKPCLTIGLH